MKISNVEAWPISMNLRQPYTIAYEQVEKIVNVFLKIETNHGILGLGCAAPDSHVTGENAESVLNDINNIVEPVLRGRDPLRISLCIEELKQFLKEHTSTLACVDMALHDLLGKYCRLPLWKLLGGYRECMKTSVTIGIMSVEKTVQEARKYTSHGFSALKLKGGRDVNEDILKVKKIREVLGKDVEIRFDANQGYLQEQALFFVQETVEAEVELLEQPTPREAVKELGGVTRNASIPIMADESIMSLKDVFKLAKGDLVDMVNIKLMKAGGIYEALMINSVARSAGIEVMVGCMDESSLSIAAGLHFALSRPNICYVDLDGFIGLMGDPSWGAIVLEKGVLYPCDGPGLGCNMIIG
jgi:L-alanine-DL-glutamate epimerase-like enolase superfamily enzyme